MNKKLQKDLSTLENLVRVQKDCVADGGPGAQYMHGMLNGLILAHSVIDGCNPRYYSRPFRKKRRNVRHKSLIIRKRSR